MQVLLADPDLHFSQKVSSSWDLNLASISVVENDVDLISVLNEAVFETIFLSTNFLIINQLDAISFIKEHSPSADVVVLCDAKSLDLAEKSLSKGATSYLLKPVSVKVLQDTARKGLARSSNRKNHRLLEEHVLEDLLGNTPAMRKILRTMYKVAPTNSSILITGESGTGKEFVSNIIHRLSKRSEEPFVAVNCGAIPDNIVESELFGHVKGSFTGALNNKTGLIEEAEGGTLFLDELGELPHATQVKLLRFLENREIRPVGSSENIKVDVRIIAATNKDIQVAIAEKTFREDLFYRLNTFQLHLPPLRERSVTIPSLIRFFALKFTRELEKEITSIEPAAQVALSSYPYPGNVRELSNIIEHAIVLSEDGVIRIGDLPSDVSKLNEIKSLPVGHGVEGGEVLFSEESPESLRSLGEVEKDHIILALTVMNNNQTDTAKKLGISRSTLWRKIQDHKIKLS